MDKSELFRDACRQFGSLVDENPPMRIDGMTSVAWNLIYQREGEFALVHLLVENEIGIADRGIKGYTPTPCAIAEGVDGAQAVDWFNEKILGLTKDAAARIVLSTMGG